MTSKILSRGTLDRLDRMQVQVETIGKWQRDRLCKTIDQYDQLISDPHIDSASKLRAIESKARCLAILGNNSNRIGIALERERREHEVRNYTKIRAVEVMNTSERLRQRALSLNVPSANHIPEFMTPKVRMFVPGCILKATVGNGAIKNDPPANWTPEVSDEGIPD